MEHWNIQRSLRGQESPRKKYDRAGLTGKEKLAVFFAAGAAAGITAVLFYQSWFGMVSLFLYLPVLCRIFRERKEKERKRKLLLEFKDAMQSISVALQAGYSLENAWKESEREMAELHGEDAQMVRSLHQMNLAAAMNQPIEKLFYEFAAVSGCEDILNFAEVFLFAKRSGGDFGRIIKSTTERIRDKMEVEEEIQTVLSGKKMEQKIMSVIPIGLLVYLRLTSGDFLAPLYGNKAGICVMTGALAAYGVALWLSEKIISIKV